MSRRFLYMVAGNCSFAPSSYTLHRIDPSRLFYPKDSAKREAAAVAAGAKATTMEAAEAAQRARTARMREAAAEEFRASKTRLRETMRQRVMRLRAAMRQRAKNRTKEDDTEKGRLPVPRMNFSSPSMVMDFALIGKSKDKIVVVDGANPGYAARYAARDDWDAPGRAVLYDDASHSVRAQQSVRLPKRERETVPVAVGDNLYFMEKGEAVVSKEKYIRALIRYPEREPDCDGISDCDYLEPEPDSSDSDWYWYSFPPPPYEMKGAGENEVRPRPERIRDMLDAYAVVGESHIWASTRISGTFSMDTVSGTWSRASDSPLPFRGRAEYAPEHGLWFGFPNDEWQYESGDSGLLCAWDLNSVKPGGASAPLQASGVWEVFRAPSGSFNVRSHLVHLGDGGRFCVAKLYQINKPLPSWACSRCYNDGDPTEISFAVLTGVEVERCDGGELRMVKHRSCKYTFGEYINFPRKVFLPCRGHPCTWMPSNSLCFPLLDSCVK